MVGTLKDASIEFEMPWDTASDGFQAVKDAYFDDTVIGLCLADNPLGEGGAFPAGTEVFRADCAILKFERNEPLEQAVSVSVTEFGSVTSMPGNTHDGAFDWMRSVVEVPKLSSAHTPANRPLIVARRWLTMSCRVSP